MDLIKPSSHTEFSFFFWGKALSAEQPTLDQARNLALEHARAGRMSEAECFSNAILDKFPHDVVANYVHGLVAFHFGHHGYAITLFRNVLREDPNHSDARQALAMAIRTMRSANLLNVCVVGDSHTGLFRPIKDVSVVWLGPVTMRRLGREGNSFLNYGDLGIPEGSSIISVFGEIDVRTRFMTLSDGSERSISETADALASRYLLTLSDAMKASGAKHQIVSSLVPPFREGIDVSQGSIGTTRQRVAATLAINDRLRFGSKVLGFSYLDLYGIFSDEAGTLSEKFTDDGIHINDTYANLAAQALREIL